MLSVAMAWSSADGVVNTLCTSAFMHDTVFSQHAPVGHNQARHYISMSARRQNQLDIRQLVFGQVHQNASLAVKSAIYNCLITLSFVS